MNYSEAKALSAALDIEVTRAGDIINAFPKGPMGLTPDAVRVTPEWKLAKRNFDTAFAKLRAFNSYYVKTFSIELRRERRARDAARQAS